jgi:hypothetical protein
MGVARAINSSLSAKPGNDAIARSDGVTGSRKGTERKVIIQVRWSAGNQENMMKIA